VNIHNAFHQGQFQNVADFDISAFSTSNELHARILQYRARVELGEASAVLSDIGKNDGEPDLAAVKLFAQYSTKPDEAIAGPASALAKAHGDNTTVQLLCGTVLASAGMKDEATALLAKHQGSLDAYVTGVSDEPNALTWQRRVVSPCWYRSISHETVSIWQYKKCARPAAGHRTISLSTWQSLGLGFARFVISCRQRAAIRTHIDQGGEKYQSAFYVYEELATAPSTSSTRAILGQAIAELHLGRLPEAEAALNQALSSTGDANVVANSIVLNTILGKETGELLETLQRLDSKHLLLDDLETKREAFATAKTKYQPRFEVQA